MGPEVQVFEKELQDYLRAPFVVTVNSCTSALFLSLLVHGIGPGDEVICPSLTWCSTANAALYLGARPVFCDIDPDTFCMTPEYVLTRLTDRTRAVMIVHYGGLTVDIDAIRNVLPDNVVIIEDAAHAMGAKYSNGKIVGSSGNFTCFSFYANKNLSTGEGGAIALFDEKVADRLRSLRLHALTADAWRRFSDPDSIILPMVNELGYKMNYTDLQASLGRVQLQRQADFSTLRLQIARRYVEGLRRIVPGITLQADVLDMGHARHLFVILWPLSEMGMTRDELLKEMRNRNIGASVHYVPLHMMPFYQLQDRIVLENTEKIYPEIMTLPIGANMMLDDVDYVLEQINDLLGQESK